MNEQGTSLGPNVLNCVEAIDHSSLCQAIILSCDGGPQHLQDEIFNKLPDHIREVVEQEIPDEVPMERPKVYATKQEKQMWKDAVQDHVQALRAVLEDEGVFEPGAIFTGRCMKCNPKSGFPNSLYAQDVWMPCYEGRNNREAQGAISVVIAGVECLDWTKRGKQKGLGGPGAKALIVFLLDLKMRKKAVGILECTELFDHTFAQEVLGPEYGTMVLVLCSTKFGWPAIRIRKWILAWLTTKYLFTGCKEEFESIMFRECQMVGEDFYVLSNEDPLVLKDLARRAKKAGLQEAHAHGEATPTREQRTRCKTVCLCVCVF